MIEQSGEGVSSPSERRLKALLDSLAGAFQGAEGRRTIEDAAAGPGLAEEIRANFPALELIERIQGGPSLESAPPEASQPAPGLQELRLGEYRLIREIGRGGMGVVYEAFQESLERRVAVKVLPFHALTSKRLIERFRQEAKLAASLEHPHIVAIHGLYVERGIYYYVMQYVEGASLDKVLKALSRLVDPDSSKEPTPPDDPSSTLALDLLSPAPERLSPGPATIERVREGAGSPLPRAMPDGQPPGEVPERYYLTVARLVRQAADALAYAHDHGILHRDIKPANLILDRGERIRVADFGLAKAAGGQDLTASGELVGTPAYMAPERFHGRTDARSDIYSLGLTLHELMTLGGRSNPDHGRPGGESLPASPGGIVEAPAALAAVALKAISLDPGLRQQSSRELVRDLDAFIEGRAVSATARRPPSRSRRRMWSIGAAGALLVLGMAALAIWWLAPEILLIPGDVVAVDLDGDGKIDLAVTGSGTHQGAAPGSLLLFFNDGSGGFEPALRIPMPVWGFRLVAADFDGDGKNDLAASIMYGRAIQVFRQEGRRRFVPRDRIEFANMPMAIAAADFDGDGRPDLAATFAASDEVRLLKNLDGGRFDKESKVLRAGAGPNFIEAVDLDGDGRPDLVVPNSSAKTLSILLNKGDWSFSAETYPLSRLPYGAALLDADQDGNVDVVLALWSPNSPEFQVYRNTGHGKLYAGAIYPLPYGVASLIAADLNGDGAMDLVGVGDLAYACFIPNMGDGRFGEPVSLEGTKKPSFVKAADLDGDGRLDLAITNVVPEGSVAVLINQGGGKFRPLPEVRLRYRRYPWSAP